MLLSGSRFELDDAVLLGIGLIYSWYVERLLHVAGISCLELECGNFHGKDIRQRLRVKTKLQRCVLNIVHSWACVFSAT